MVSLILVQRYLKQFQVEDTVIEKLDDGYYSVKLNLPMEKYEWNLNIRFRERGLYIFFFTKFVQYPSEMSACKSLLERLMRLNNEIIMTKFSLNDCHEIIASVELPAEHLDYYEFQAAIYRLMSDCDGFLDEITNM